MNVIDKHKIELTQACIDYKVKELYTFGSVLSKKFNSDSDIDFIVSIDSEDPLEYGENYFKLKFELEKIFGRKIDLLEQKAISNKLFMDLINQNKMLIYARRNQGVA